MFCVDSRLRMSVSERRSGRVRSSNRGASLPAASFRLSARIARARFFGRNRPGIATPSSGAKSSPAVMPAASARMLCSRKNPRPFSQGSQSTSVSTLLFAAAFAARVAPSRRPISPTRETPVFLTSSTAVPISASQVPMLITSAGSPAESPVPV